MSTPALLETLRRELEDAAVLLGRPHDLRFKPMFGGLMAYLDEKPCAWLTSAGLALKLAPTDQPALLQLKGATRLIAKPGAAPSRHDIVLPASLRRDTAQLAGEERAAMTFNASAAPARTACAPRRPAGPAAAAPARSRSR